MAEGVGWSVDGPPTKVRLPRSMAAECSEATVQAWRRTTGASHSRPSMIQGFKPLVVSRAA